MHPQILNLGTAQSSCTVYYSQIIFPQNILYVFLVCIYVLFLDCCCSSMFVYVRVYTKPIHDARSRRFCEYTTTKSMHIAHTLSIRLCLLDFGIVAIESLSMALKFISHFKVKASLSKNHL